MPNPIPDNWLVDRLTPVKQDAVRWRELFETIEEYYQANVETVIDWLTSLRSIFTAESIEDKQRILFDLGWFFGRETQRDSLDDAYRARLYEISRKNTDEIVRGAIRRAGISDTARWLPLFTFSTPDNYGKPPVGGTLEDTFYTARTYRTVRFEEPYSIRFEEGSRDANDPTFNENVFAFGQIVVVDTSMRPAGYADPDNPESVQSAGFIPTSRGAVIINISEGRPVNAAAEVERIVSGLLPIYVIYGGLRYEVIETIAGVSQVN